MTLPFKVEPITDDIVPYVEDGQIVWKVGNIEYTTTFSRRDSGYFLTVKPNAVGRGSWKPLPLDEELYYGNFQLLRLKSNHLLWWRWA